MATYICNPSTWEAKAERSGIKAIPQQENESRNNGEFYRKSHPSAIEPKQNNGKFYRKIGNVSLLRNESLPVPPK